MAIQQPYMNPVKFYNPNRLPDFSTYWPNQDNVLPRNKYVRGQSPADYYREHLVNKVIRFQIRFDSVSDTDIEVYKWVDNNWTLQTTAAKTNIIPSGWTSFDVFKFEYTPSSEGIYQFRMKSENLRTDPIFAVSRTKFKRGIVQLEFWHSENKLGMVFWDNGTQVYTGLAYMSGILEDGEPENEISAFQDDPGVFTKLSATPVPTAMLRITDWHYMYKELINYIFACDNIRVNGILYQNPEIFEVEKVENSDIRNASVKLYETKGTHFRNNF